MLGWFFAVQNTSTGYGTLLLLAFLCGVGGGSFSGYMPSTGYFFPKSKQGTALGVQAGIGNLGMSIVQLLGPWLMGFGLLGLTWIAPQHTAGSPLWVHNIAIVFVPWTILATILAFTMLKDVPVKANFRRQIDIFTNPDTWIMTLMYVMTFGLFSGFSAQFGLLIENTYGNSSNLAHGFSNLPAGASYAFLGPLIGSLVRVVWGPLCDRFGGAIWTLVSGIGMALTFGFCVFFLNPTSPSQFGYFLWGMLTMFFFSGIGNAGTFKQMPMIMPARQAGGAIGFTAAIGCFGPFVVGVALSSMSAVAWFWICTVFCIVCSIICWIRYARPGAPCPG
jgi:NNP family nitrate/nitrite transporter-like MFS transporter